MRRQFSSNSQLLHVFNNKGASIGQLIDISPLQFNFIPCSGSHSELTLSFYTQNGLPLQMLDQNITVKLLFKKNDDNED